MEKDFDEWNSLKKKINNKKEVFVIPERFGGVQLE